MTHDQDICWVSHTIYTWYDMPSMYIVNICNDVITYAIQTQVLQCIWYITHGICVRHMLCTAYAPHGICTARHKLGLHGIWSARHINCTTYAGLCNACVQGTCFARRMLCTTYVRHDIWWVLQCIYVRHMLCTTYALHDIYTVRHMLGFTMHMFI